MTSYWTIPVDDKSTYFKKHLKLIKSTIDKEWEWADSEKKRIEQYIKKGGTYSDLEDPADYLGNIAWEIDEMSQLMYRSFIIGIFVFMESQITQLCEQIKITEKQIFSYKDLSGNGIGRSIKYINTVLKIQFPTDEDLREKFETARIVRNALVHKDGELYQEDIPKIKKYMENNSDNLNIDKDKIILMYKYAESLIDINTRICDGVTKYNRIEDAGKC